MDCPPTVATGCLAPVVPIVWADPRGIQEQQLNNNNSALRYLECTPRVYPINRKGRRSRRSGTCLIYLRFRSKVGRARPRRPCAVDLLNGEAYGVAGCSLRTR